MKRLSSTDQSSTDHTNLKNLTFTSQSGQSYAAGKWNVIGFVDTV